MNITSALQGPGTQAAASNGQDAPGSSGSSSRARGRARGRGKLSKSRERSVTPRAAAPELLEAESTATTGGTTPRTPSEGEVERNVVCEVEHAPLPELGDAERGGPVGPGGPTPRREPTRRAKSVADVIAAATGSSTPGYVYSDCTVFTEEELSKPSWKELLEPLGIEDVLSGLAADCAEDDDEDTARLMRLNLERAYAAPALDHPVEGPIGVAPPPLPPLRRVSIEHCDPVFFSAQDLAGDAGAAESRLQSHELREMDPLLASSAQVSRSLAFLAKNFADAVQAVQVQAAPEAAPAEASPPIAASQPESLFFSGEELSAGAQAKDGDHEDIGSASANVSAAPPALEPSAEPATEAAAPAAAVDDDEPAGSVMGATAAPSHPTVEQEEPMVFTEAHLSIGSWSELLASSPMKKQDAAPPSQPDDRAEVTSPEAAVIVDEVLIQEPVELQAEDAPASAAEGGVEAHHPAAARDHAHAHEPEHELEPEHTPEHELEPEPEHMPEHEIELEPEHKPEHEHEHELSVASLGDVHAPLEPEATHAACSGINGHGREDTHDQDAPLHAPILKHEFVYAQVHAHDQPIEYSSHQPIEYSSHDDAAHDVKRDAPDNDVARDDAPVMTRVQRALLTALARTRLGDVADMLDGAKWAIPAACASFAVAALGPAAAGPVRTGALAAAYILAGLPNYVESAYVAGGGNVDVHVLTAAGSLGAAVLGHAMEGAMLAILFRLVTTGLDALRTTADANDAGVDLVPNGAPRLVGAKQSEHATDVAEESELTEATIEYAVEAASLASEHGSMDVEMLSDARSPSYCGEPIRDDVHVPDSAHALEHSSDEVAAAASPRSIAVESHFVFFSAKDLSVEDLEAAAVPEDEQVMADTEPSLQQPDVPPPVAESEVHVPDTEEVAEIAEASSTAAAVASSSRGAVESHFVFFSAEDLSSHDGDASMALEESGSASIEESASTPEARVMEELGETSNTAPEEPVRLASSTSMAPFDAIVKSPAAQAEPKYVLFSEEHLSKDSWSELLSRYEITAEGPGKRYSLFTRMVNWVFSSTAQPRQLAVA